MSATSQNADKLLALEYWLESRNALQAIISVLLMRQYEQVPVLCDKQGNLHFYRLGSGTEIAKCGVHSAQLPRSL